MRKSHWIMLSWICVNVQKRWKLPRNAKPQNLQTFGETEATKSPRPVSQGDMAKQFHSSWEVNTSDLFLNVFCLVVCFRSSNFSVIDCKSVIVVKGDVYQLRSSVDGVWRVGYQRDKKVDQVEWSVVKSILLRYFEPNSDSVCSYDNPLEWWYGGMVIWPKLNVPCCIAQNFRANFAGRQRRKTDDRSDGFECVEWGWVMWRKSMTRGEKRFFRSFPQTLRNSVMFLLFLK